MTSAASFSSGMIQNAQFMGLINALRTGDPTVDMIAAILLPFGVQKAVTEIPKAAQKLIRHLLGKKKIPIRKYRRNIIYRTTQSGNGTRMSSDEDSFNMYLLRAIQLYVHNHCDLQKQDDAHLDLTLLDTSRCSQNVRNGRMTLLQRNPNGLPYGDGVGGSGNSNSTVDMLQTCSLVEKPLENIWLNVGKHGGGDVEIMICDSVASSNAAGGGGNNQQSNQEAPLFGSHDDGYSGGDGGPGGGKNGSTTQTLEVKLQSTKSVQCLHAFVNNAFDWYCNEIRKTENKDRFMLDVQPMGIRNNTPQYVAYKLGDEKTFDTLFNQKCHELLRVVDHFENKTGKYAIKGYPHKLGLLLTGIPGTGKTSLIKALAHYTGRHIVNINLGHISTNSDLRKIFFNKNYQVISGGAAGYGTDVMRLDFSQCIFVMEDVDAAAKEVIMDRQLLAELREEASANKMKAANSTGDTNKPGEGTAAASNNPFQPPGGGAHRGGGGYGPGPSIQGLDKLNLSGLLNVLDGVVETPGRIVIMTTNHPEILDPALIRPGRIDKILELGYMQEPADIIAMLEHYYPSRKLTQEEHHKITECIQPPATQGKDNTNETDVGVKITPAQVEQLAMEEETVEGFLDKLYSHGKEDNNNNMKKKSRIPDSFVIRATKGSTSTVDSSNKTASTASGASSSSTSTENHRGYSREQLLAELSLTSSSGYENGGGGAYYDGGGYYDEEYYDEEGEYYGDY